uniref:Vomeronasal type-1 receptor n=1 Tax=Cricetulus griseus TaxID=10029 RepID=A0A8C2MA23_CRIGR
MIWSDLMQQIIFLSLTGLGILGNILLFMRHVHVFIMDLNFTHLVFSNVNIYTSAVKYTVTKLHFKNVLGDAGCKTVVYLGRVERVFTTCLLSKFQADFLVEKLRPQTTRQILPFLLLLSLNRSRAGVYNGYCYMLPSRYTVNMALPDAIFQSLMGWSSEYMAFHLYRYHKYVLYLHSSRFANSASPEVRAAWSVLILMTFDYPALSSFILIIKDFHLTSCWQTDFF